MPSLADRPRTYMIGRNAACDVCIENDTVSRFHAELVLSTDGQLFLMNRSSSGLWVYREHRWVEWSRPDYVEHGDRVRLGRFETTVADIVRRVPGLNQGGS